MFSRLYQIIKGRLWQKDSAVPESTAHIKLIYNDFREVSAEVIVMPGTIVYDGKLFVFDRHNIYRQTTVERLEIIAIDTILADAAKAKLDYWSVEYSDYGDDRLDVFD